jgi:hypothetical protein
MNKSFLLALVHMGIVAALWGTYGAQESNSPRAWTRTQPVDPYDLMRGRYVRLSLLALAPQFEQYKTGELYVMENRLHFREAACCTSASMSNIPGYALLGGSVSFFIPEDIPDPSVLKPGEELWAEVSIPPGADPRPIRLAVKSPNGDWRELPAGKR